MNIIHVGSMNQTKIIAAKNIFLTHAMFKDFSVSGVNVAVEEFGHPKTINETIRGAKERARTSLDEAKLSVGLESGLIEASEASTGYLETTVCALFDGERYAIGLAPSFEWPKKVLRLILGGRDGSQAFKEAGLTSHKKLGTTDGAIYALTKGVVNRTQLNEAAIIMALTQLQHPDYY